MSNNEPVVITGEDNIHFAAGLTIATMFAIEIRTGMQASRHGSALKAAKVQGFIPKDKRPNKVNALKMVVAELQRLRPEYTPNSSVQAALKEV